MSVQLYKPFESFNFSNKQCFLSGETLSSSEEKIAVFPAWLMSRYNLQQQPFKLLDESMATYGDLKIPCSAAINEQYLEPLEQRIADAFEGGYDAVKVLDEMQLFLWAGKLLYGIIFNELQIAIRQSHAQGEEFNISQSIIHKFSNLHLMLQSLNKPIIFEEFKPFSLFLFKVNNHENEFAYRDEINTLTFAIRVRDFGLVICLQDNGANRNYHKNILSKIEGQTLHPIQFEEFSGRVFYSAYLFNRLPEYDILPVGDEVYLEAMGLKGMSAKPLFDDWLGKTYGQVLETFWKPWGFLLLEIIKNPEHPMSFLLDKEENFIPADTINQPI
ncbi:hypothetical protein [uncultured Mucilaginibacter sp.]|uniref:hypothetical protein n=1 Tax=uncultured Mucilaginibacter sp. TaxID=797541 RepID=UPI0025EC0B43|nr:hypothetical protein [uncultured Mucilaginibacter sp.]